MRIPRAAPAYQLHKLPRVFGYFGMPVAAACHFAPARRPGRVSNWEDFSASTDDSEFPAFRGPGGHFLVAIHPITAALPNCLTLPHAETYSSCNLNRPIRELLKCVI